MSGQKKAIVFLCEGAEEMEFTITVDILRRAKVEVTVVGVEIANEVAVCSRGVKIAPDVKFSKSLNSENYDAVIIPGGNGSAKTLCSHEDAKKLIMDFYNSKKIVAFICAGTLVAEKAGIPHKHTVTSYPAFKKQLEKVYTYSDDRVVVDDNVITSRSPGTTFLFALTIVEKLLDVGTANSLRDEMLTCSAL
ncbi:class I glutamine amidotransferase-like protein [Parasitella parasitica]|nr:class I glutamine amidotransferase-like protein [Parasitella parasitica]